MKVKKSKFEGIFFINGRLATKNPLPGIKIVNEELVRKGKTEYRIWDPYTSKPAAAIKKGLRVFPLRKGMRILYLGFGAGKTGSFFSDLIGEGIIYGVDVSPIALRDAVRVAELRKNITCILANASKPETYADRIFGKIDLLYVDVASPDQIRILQKNAEKFLERGDWAIIAIKSQSIDSTKPPSEVYRQCLQELSKNFEVLDKVRLDPYEKGHLFVVMKYKATRL